MTGTYTAPANGTAPIGPSFQPGAGLEAWPFTNRPVSLSVWKFDSPSQTWLVRSDTNVPGQSDFPTTLAPGGAVMTRTAVATTLEVPDGALGIRYYHRDHLGSSSVVTDTAGQLVEEAANYAFGQFAIPAPAEACSPMEHYDGPSNRHPAHPSRWSARSPKSMISSPT